MHPFQKTVIDFVKYAEKTEYGRDAEKEDDTKKLCRNRGCCHKKSNSRKKNNNRHDKEAKNNCCIKAGKTHNIEKDNDQT